MTPRPTVASAIGARVVATRGATRDLFGEVGVENVLAMLAADERALFTGATPPKWVPEQTYIAWTRAVYAGPAGRDSATLARWVDRVTDRGFGAARRMLMSLASPWVIVRRAGALWRGEHSHGELTSAPLGDNSARFELRDSPYAVDDLGASAISEAFRYILFRCRVKWATEEHRRIGDALHVELRWG
ncbi:MAG: hypothetical protein ABJE66_06175 [Deltaproteobacteria bacterium]